ncbi:hypothetical protein [Nocardioides sp. zg-DK7169]|uniref:hypothetical protein n=1 Tax=Nocardioides sp. zg-DK7169 TaxID=2736600 RepID=UPI001C1309D5|nr:hypothetical protein [Nocardioides sp. zg-DK7169]
MDNEDDPGIGGPATAEADLDGATLGADVDAATAEQEIADAVSARHSIARKYVGRVRRRHPETSPAGVVALLERHYITAISVAGGVTTAGSIAANVGLSLVPGASVGKEASKASAKAAAKKVAARAAAKSAAKAAAANMARTGVARMVPAGDERLQFEITAIFALALAEIHDMRLDQDQAKALVYGLSNDRVSQKQISAMANDVARATRSASGLGEQLASAQDDWTHWADTLASQLPGTAARDLVRTVQTGQLATIRSGLSDGQKSIVEHGVGAVAGGMTRFVFGREVVNATRVAFPAPPQDFPRHLALEAATSNDEDEASAAYAALEEAAKSTAAWMSSTAGRATRVFRNVDLDGDGIPDEAQAVTALKNAGSAVSGAGSTAARAFRRIDRDGDGVPDDPAALAALRDIRGAALSRLKRSKSAPEPDEERADRQDLKAQIDELMRQYQDGEIDAQTYAQQMMELTTSAQD